MAEPKIFFDNNSWIFPPTESEYREAIDGFIRYRDRLGIGGEFKVGFGAKLDGAIYLDVVDDPGRGDGLVEVVVVSEEGQVQLLLAYLGQVAGTVVADVGPGCQAGLGSLLIALILDPGADGRLARHRVQVRAAIEVHVVPRGGARRLGLEDKEGVGGDDAIGQAQIADLGN